jgi:hypothetical protein
MSVRMVTPPLADGAREIRQAPNTIDTCRAKMLFAYGLSEEELRREEQTIIIKKLLERYFPVE